jgi:phosphoribosylaminoimidazolesuccinocarboxamide synthase
LGGLIMEKKKNEIILFENQGIKLEVNVKDDTVWLTQEQMSKLFGKAKSTINEHIKNIFKENELQENETMTKFGNSEFSDKPTNYYNLDMIISVGYRVKSQQGIAFRKWSTKVLKDYMLKGYAINQKRLEYLEKTVQLIDIANRIDNQIEADEIKNVLKVIGEYTKALDLLDSYDYRSIKKIKGTDSLKQIKYEDCKLIIENLKFNEKSNLFAVERDRGLEAIIGNIYQSFDGEYIYKSVEEKAANFLYLIVKNHVFVDGNKRIAATLFIYFLEFYNILYKDNKQVIDNNTLAALTLLIAESNPKEKDILVDLVTNFLNNN